ncbi:MAG: hypothetical protein M1347_01425 [Chloroflexi bacterium]|nr:hypothetical protein [Chloroflexota bacterium]
MSTTSKPIIGVVGPCKSGKSTLVRGLQQAGYKARQIVQEHSFAPRMWQQISHPDILIYLHCNYETTVIRGLNWLRSEYDEQQPRLTHARQNAVLEITTDDIQPTEVLEKVLSLLKSRL